MLKTPITFCNFFFIWFTSFQRKCNQKQKKDNSIQIVNSPFLVKIKRSKLVIFKLPLSSCYNCFDRCINATVIFLSNHDLEHSISFSQKYPVGTVLSCTYNESEEYMYLYTISDTHYAIYLEDACEGVYIVEPIIIYDYKQNGELVDEDTKEILTGILETTQRLNTYNCTKALLEQL